jgi:hypothetical protein
MKVMIATAVAAVALVLSGAPAYAADDAPPTVTVIDKPGAPGEMLEQMAKLMGRPVGTLEKVIAVDPGEVQLTAQDVEALVAGADVAGVKVLGVMAGGKELLETTMSDLSDGQYDGPRDSTETYRSAVIFADDIFDYGWVCLTMCIQHGRTPSECMDMARR